MITPPPEVDLNYYRNSYPELKNFPDIVLLEHYKKFAVEQGHTTCAYDRREYLNKFLMDAINTQHLSVLEISPWHNPFLRGDNVKYFDADEPEALRKSAIEMGLNPEHVPQKIDFISPSRDLGVIDETFDIVFSSHVIEHVPDLIEHFQNVSKILNAGGVYVLIIPDKRYCFDYYHSESTITEVIDAFITVRKFPLLSNAINGLTNTHNNAVLHWLGQHGDRYGYGTNKIDREKLFTEIKEYPEALAANEYIDTHNWRFTPDNFGYIVDILNKLEFIDLRLYRLCHTIWGRFEFVTMLEKP